MGEEWGSGAFIQLFSSSLLTAHPEQASCRPLKPHQQCARSCTIQLPASSSVIITFSDCFPHPCCLSFLFFGTEGVWGVSLCSLNDMRLTSMLELGTESGPFALSKRLKAAGHTDNREPDSKDQSFPLYWRSACHSAEQNVPT